jgi:UDP-N-acetylmuramyl pentapeptide phosphotransferase/UDP-N-acetylglucosamine-1-phosphate transferase
MAWAMAGAPAGVLICTLVLVALVRRWLERHNILDVPGVRSAHDRAVPRGGGLGVVPPVIVSWFALAFLGHSTEGAATVAAAAAALAVLSWCDDLKGLPIAPRLIGHAAAVVLGLTALPATVFQGLLSPMLDRALAAVAWVWFVNLFNFMDGIDGISGIETAALGLGVALVSQVDGFGHESDAPLALSLAVCGLAFLRWNWHPAQIFLGDVGSIPLGYLLGFLLLNLAAHGSWAPALILPLYYLADSGITIALRVKRGERFWQAHRQHFYQRALAPDGNHAAVARLVLVCDAMLVALALVAVLQPWPALAVASTVVGIMLWLLVQREARCRVR